MPRRKKQTTLNIEYLTLQAMIPIRRHHSPDVPEGLREAGGGGGRGAMHYDPDLPFRLQLYRYCPSPFLLCLLGLLASLVWTTTAQSNIGPRGWTRPPTFREPVQGCGAPAHRNDAEKIGTAPAQGRQHSSRACHCLSSPGRPKKHSIATRQCRDLKAILGAGLVCAAGAARHNKS